MGAAILDWHAGADALDYADAKLYTIPPSDAEDARRYRWLRDTGDSTWMPLVYRPLFFDKQNVDAYIDDAMKGEDHES